MRLLYWEKRILNRNKLPGMEDPIKIVPKISQGAQSASSQDTRPVRCEIEVRSHKSIWPPDTSIEDLISVRRRKDVDMSGKNLPCCRNTVPNVRASSCRWFLYHQPSEIRVPITSCRERFHLQDPLAQKSFEVWNAGLDSKHYPFDQKCGKRYLRIE